MNDIEVSARHLMELLHAPAGCVTILPWAVGSNPVLRVLIDPSNRLIESKLPSEFEGYKVMVEIRPQFLAQMCPFL